MIEAITKIPGTLFSLKLGTEGKNYAIYLVRGRQSIASKKLDTVRGTSLRNLPGEIEDAMRLLLDEAEIFLSHTILSRVVDELLTKVPEKEAAAAKEPASTVDVRKLIEESEERAKKQEIAPTIVRSKPSASADDLGKITLRPPKPLPKRALTRGEAVSQDQYLALVDKVEGLINDLESLQNLAAKNDKEIKKLKRKLASLKKSSTKKPTTKKSSKTSEKTT